MTRLGCFDNHSYQYYSMQSVFLSNDVYYATNGQERHCFLIFLGIYSVRRGEFEENARVLTTILNL